MAVEAHPMGRRGVLETYSIGEAIERDGFEAGREAGRQKEMTLGREFTEGGLSAFCRFAVWRGRGIHGVDFTSLYIFVSRRGSEQRKETPKKQRQCRHLPRLGFPLWNPSSEAPPLQDRKSGV